jgi:hypothetical protein
MAHKQSLGIAIGHHLRMVLASECNSANTMQGRQMRPAGGRGGRWYARDEGGTI